VLESGRPEPDSPSPAAGHDPRYLAGVALFNRGEYFDAHDVWEELWQDCPSADRRFYQSLIQAAVALYHWGNGNRTGAVRLFHSGRRYMDPYRPAHRGLDVDRFWREVEAALAPALADAGAAPGVPGPPPRIHLGPPPTGGASDD
jgi:predicted metal-dependent hydrolase